MARGQKKQYVKKLTTKDEEMLRAFRNCGRLSSKHLKSELTMADKRVLNFQRDGYLEHGRLLNPKTREMESVFQLTDKGRGLVDAQLNLSHFYKSVGGRHDLAVADKYFSLNQEEQHSWRTEGELREVFQARLEELGGTYQAKEVSATDGAYVARDGRTILFEVVTRNYGKAEIQAKENFATLLGLELEISKT
ncbi:hypothetical protein [Sporosarcina sp. FSL K6-5500]|uniref:hypothetical protein n=1 Tax=Sporosarcina sp. FSL K6-5500 TaxID=2921558 RepID=UPI0030F73C01